MTPTLRSFAAGFLGLLLFAAALLAQGAEPVGRVLLARGDVTATAPDGSVRFLERRALVFELDVLETGPGGILQVRFDDGATLELRSASRLEVAEYRYNRPAEGADSVLMRVFTGAMRAVSGVIGGEQYEVVTPVASIGIRGTHYETAEEDDGAWVFGVWAGGIVVRNEYGSVELGSDRSFLFARARASSAPVGLVSAPGALSSPPAGGGGGEQESAAGGAGASAGPSAGAGAGATSGAAGLALAPAPTDTGAVTDVAAASDVVALATIPPVNPAEGVATDEELQALSDTVFGSGFELSNRERAALASGRERGILVLEDGRVVTGPATVGDDGGPLFVLDLDDGGQALIRGGDANVTDPPQNVGGFDVSWGSFAAGGPQVFLADGSRVTEGELRGDLDFLVVEAAQLADLTVRASYEGDLAFGRTSAGEITDFGVFFDADLDLGDGSISDGRLLLEAGGGLEEYRVAFEGLVRGGEATLGVTRGTITGSAIDGTLDVDRDLSVLQGLFTTGGEGFAGGFNLQQAGNADRFARGGFLAEKVSETGAVEAAAEAQP